MHDNTHVSDNAKRPNNSNLPMKLIEDYEIRPTNVFEFMENNIDSEITLDDLASVSNFSKFHFSRLFSALVGEAPFEFIQRTRLERASILL